MAELRFDSKNISTLIKVKESDKHSRLVHVHFEHDVHGDKSRTDEMYLTPSQLQLLGLFLLRMANEVATEQTVRDNE